MKNKNLKIIVTGGAGFIGSHLVDAYIKKKHRVLVIDDLSTGFRKNINPKAKFFKTNILNSHKIEAIFKKEKPDIVNHCAAITSVVTSTEDPFSTFMVNVLGTLNLLLSFVRCPSNKKKKFIFASSGGAIYGEHPERPVSEKIKPIPISPYGLSKLFAEEVIKFYSRLYGFDYLIFRYPNIYGPRQNPKGEAGVVAIFSHLMMNNRRSTIYGDGNKTRDYVYIDDIIKANLLGLVRGKNEILNLGWGKEIKDKKIFDLLAKEINFSGEPIYSSFRSGEVYRIALFAESARKVLKWKPKIKLEDGIKKYLNHLKFGKKPGKYIKAKKKKTKFF